MHLTKVSAIRSMSPDSILLDSIQKDQSVIHGILNMIADAIMKAKT